MVHCVYLLQVAKSSLYIQCESKKVAPQNFLQYFHIG